MQHVNEVTHRTAEGLALVESPAKHHGYCEDCGRPTEVVGELNERSKDGLRTCRSCLPPSSGYEVVYPKDEEKEKGFHRGENGVAHSLTRVPRGHTETEPVELYELIARKNNGDLQPLDVELGPLPNTARHSQRAAAANIALLMGLRLAVDEDRPLPYSASFCAEQIGLGRDKRRASRVIASLVKSGVIVEAGEMPRRPGRPYGTKLYLPPGSDDQIVQQASRGTTLATVRDINHHGDLDA